jgi:hypothetical protein
VVTSLRKRPPQAQAWAFLAYRLPREPSAPRLALWRALRRLGAHQVSDGLIALPHSARNLEHLEWLAAGILEANGTASVWLAEPTSTRTHEAYVAAMRGEADGEYRAVLHEAREARALDSGDRGRAIRRLRGQLRRIGARDYFAAPIGPAARAAVEELAATAEVPA